MIFLDTSFLFSLFSVRDPDHERVKTVFEALEGRRLPDTLLTTNHVVFETLTLVRMKTGHAAAVFVGDRLYGGHLSRIHSATLDEERQAYAYLAQHRDKRYSAVDCLSFVVMLKLGIKEAWTFDRHFEHRFIARPGPPK